MNKKQFFRFATVIVFTLACLISTSAPIVHKVTKGESIGGIAYKYKITIEELIRQNPQAKNGVRTGMQLIIDSEQTKSETPNEDALNEPKQSETPIAVQPQEETKVETPQNKSEEEQNTIDDLQKTAERNPAENACISRKGDTFKTISERYNVPVSELIELNPFIDPYNIAQGTPIRLDDTAPIYDTNFSKTPNTVVITESVDDDEAEDDANEDEAEDDATENDAPYATPIDMDDEEDGIEEIDSVQINQRSTILVLLPFFTDKEKSSVPNERYSEFYRGMMIAANDLKAWGRMNVEIFTHDVSGDTISLSGLLNKTALNDIDIIIAPEDETLFKKIAEFGEKNNIYVANFFNVRDTSYKTNEYVLQSYINQKLMYEKAIDEFMKEYEEFTPVILNALNSRNEKDSFVKALKARCQQIGKKVVDLNYSGDLTPGMISSNPNISKNERYVFVPTSGSNAVFSKFAPGLKSYVANQLSPEKTALFGYPDWTAFKGKNLSLLHDLDATIYTRFFMDSQSSEAENLLDEFERWYGLPMIESAPSMGALGYDAARMLIQWLQASQGDLQIPFEDGQLFKGVQSSFRFSHDDSAGLINTSLYIVKFASNGENIVTVI